MRTQVGKSQRNLEGECRIQDKEKKWLGQGKRGKMGTMVACEGVDLCLSSWPL